MRPAKLSATCGKESTFGRAGQEETALAIVLVDRLLDRKQQAGRTLDLVDDGLGHE